MNRENVRCPLCGSDSETWFELEHAEILRCQGSACGLGFLARQPDNETLTAYYREYYYPGGGAPGPVFENSDIAKMGQHFQALDERLAIAGKRILDYGCGVGNFLEVARTHGCEACGIEFDDEGRNCAEAKGFRVEKTVDLYEENFFDFVYMNDVIEHLRDPVADLAELRTRIRPGGAVFIVTMNMKGLKTRVAGDTWDVVTNPTHLWWYAEPSLGRTIELAGYSKWSVERFRVDFGHHGLLRRQFQRILQKTGLDASLRVLAWRGEA